MKCIQIFQKKKKNGRNISSNDLWKTTIPITLLIIHMRVEKTRVDATDGISDQTPLMNASTLRSANSPPPVPVFTFLHDSSVELRVVIAGLVPLSSKPVSCAPSLLPAAGWRRIFNAGKISEILRVFAWKIFSLARRGPVKRASPRVMRFVFV